MGMVFKEISKGELEDYNGNCLAMWFYANKPQFDTVWHDDDLGCIACMGDDGEPSSFELHPECEAQFFIVEME